MRLISKPITLIRIPKSQRKGFLVNSAHSTHFKRFAKISLDAIYYSGNITRVITAFLMSKSKVHRLGDLQLRIMKVLWERGEATVAAMHQGLADERNLAYTTMATMLRKMEARGLVKHRLEGRSFVYRPVIAEEAVSRGMADHLVERLFEGSLADMVHHLLSTREVSREELTKLEKLIAERKKAR
jgi:BlaI family penicillinase repressor